MTWCIAITGCRGWRPRCLKNAWKVPNLHMFHTLGLMKQRIGQTAEEREGETRIAGERFVMDHADLIIAATEAEKSQLEMLYGLSPQRPRLSRPGVNTHHFYPIPQDEAKAAIGIPEKDRMALVCWTGLNPLKVWIRSSGRWPW